MGSPEPQAKREGEGLGREWESHLCGAAVDGAQGQKGRSSLYPCAGSSMLGIGDPGAVGPEDLSGPFMS